jgi:hypothetical protein
MQARVVVCVLEMPTAQALPRLAFAWATSARVLNGERERREACSSGAHASFTAFYVPSHASAWSRYRIRGGRISETPATLRRYAVGGWRS